VPTLSYLDFAVRLNEQPEMLSQDADLAPFIPSRELRMDARDECRTTEGWRDDAQRAREVTNKLLRAGVTIGTGTDIWQIPTGIHMELEQLVAAGCLRLRRFRRAGRRRSSSERKGLGTIEVGKWAIWSSLTPIRSQTFATRGGSGM
jgi:hypothetical protein